LGPEVDVWNIAIACFSKSRKTPKARLWKKTNECGKKWTTALEAVVCAENKEEGPFG
jgi:hypothetical protein